MSFSKAWNAAIALVRGETRTARNILCDPMLDLEGHSIHTLQSNLEASVQVIVSREICRELKQILIESLRLEPETDIPDAHRTAFLQGQEALFALIEQHVEFYEERLSETIYVPRTTELEF